MSNVLAYSFSFGSFLVMALWWLLFRRKLKGLGAGFAYCTVFLMLGALSLHYIGVVPAECVNWLRYSTVILAIVGGFTILVSSLGTKGE